MHRIGECVGAYLEQTRTHFPTHQTAHTDVRKTYRTAHTTLSLRMNPRGSKRVGDNRN